MNSIKTLDCGDSSCNFAQNKGGMRTNGGCRCLEEIDHGQTRDLARKIRWTFFEYQRGKRELEVELAHALVLNFFNGDKDKENLWFTSPNLLLGNISPNGMINNGRISKLLKFIKEQLSLNSRY